jgi:hypothetical protein
MRHRKCRVECELLLSHRHEFDPLDREILERAFDATLQVVQGNRPSIVNFGGDDGLKTIIRRELIEIAHSNGLSDPETLRDILLTRLSSD